MRTFVRELLLWILVVFIAALVALLWMCSPASAQCGPNGCGPAGCAVPVLPRTYAVTPAPLPQAIAPQQPPPQNYTFFDKLAERIRVLEEHDSRLGEQLGALDQAAAKRFVGIEARFPLLSEGLEKAHQRLAAMDASNSSTLSLAASATVAAGRFEHDLPGLLDRIRAAEQKVTGTPGQDEVREVARNVALSIVSEKITALAPAVAPAAMSALQVGLLALGISCPVAGVGGALELMLARGAAKKVAADVAAWHLRGAGAIVSTVSGGAEETASNAVGQQPQVVTVRQDSPPRPAILATNHTYVPYEVRTIEQEALEWALADYVSRNPGGRPMVEAIENAAKQYATGHPRKN